MNQLYISTCSKTGRRFLCEIGQDNNIAENERLNKALWSLTSKMAELKGYRAEFRNGMLN